MKRHLIPQATALAPEDARRSSWMAAAQCGDRVAYETLLRDCVMPIQRVARRKRVPADRIDDVVQETLLTVHRARHTFDPTRSFTAWLHIIAERRAVDLLRRTAKHGARELCALLAYENHPDEFEIDRHTKGEVPPGLRGAIASLPRRQREAVQHLMLEDRALAETAVVTGRSTGSLKVNLHRALKTLRSRLGHTRSSRSTP
jgi:RNA polymerase sigma factor (sigma-70 family)